MKQKQHNRKRQGMALLLTLMVLMILSTAMVQFQIDAALFLRSSDYRLEQQKCRYAAESGIVIASNILLEQLRTPKSEEEADENLDAPDSLADPNGMTDPNGILDPNGWSEFSGPLEFDGLQVLLKKEIDVGDVKVTIEIYDENAKWPMLWLVPNGSPFAQSRNSQAIEQFDRLAGLLQVDQNYTEAVKRLTKEIGSKINLPQAEFTLTKLSPTQKRTTSRSRRSSRRSRSVRHRRINHIKKKEEAQQRLNSMVQFTQIFYEHMRRDPELLGLQENLVDRDSSLLEYLGFWGHNKININTAPIEVLQSAFSYLGVTSDQIQEIDEYRQEQNIKYMADLKNIGSFSTSMIQTIAPICVTKSEHFTVNVTAQLGRTQHSVIAAIHYTRGYIKVLAMINN